MPVHPFVLLLLASFFWGISVPVSKIFLTEYAPIAVLLIQLAFSSIFILGVTWFNGNLRFRGISKRNLLTIAAVGILEPGLAYFIGFYGLTQTTGINAGILQSLEPIFIVILSVVILKQTINRLLAFLVLLGLVGAFITISPEFAGSYLQPGAGDGIVLLAVFVAAVYVTLSDKFVQDYEPDLVLFIQQFSSVVFVFVVATVFFRKDLLWIPNTDFFLVGAAGIVQFGFTFLCFFMGMKRSHPFVSAVSLNLIPIFAVASSVLLLGELMQISHVIGGSLSIVSAIMISILTEKPR